MFRWKKIRWIKKRDGREQVAEYATRKDFQRIFAEEMAGLHLLAFLLTANEEKAEQCFVAGLEESARGNAVFKQWARSWSKRSVIKNAVKAISSAPAEPGLVAGDGRIPRGAMGATGAENGQASNGSTELNDPQAAALVSAVTSLEPFRRFVFVMSVLEGYSVLECSALLRRPAKEVAAAKSKALEQLGAMSAVAQFDRGDARVSWASFLAPTEPA